MVFQPIEPTLRSGFFVNAFVSFGAVFLLTAIVWILFIPALPGIIQFDDLGNLSDLNTITDFDSAWAWINQGRAGPLGRPIALATFALQYYQWPQPDALLLWNIALHLINTLLVLWLAMLLAQRLGAASQKQLAVGFLTALFWAALPLLNTSTLFIIQRMTVLSGTFVLAGLVAYLKVRGSADAHWKQQLFALVVIVGFGVLAVLTKENGALIVVYGLIIEIFVRITAVRKQRLSSLAVSIFALGCVLLAAKLLPLLFWSTSTELMRGFTMLERLASQGELLLVYLKGIFLPASSELNPFRHYGVSHDRLRIFCGVGLWIFLMLSPLLVWWRGWRLPALVFAWFFYGHILESGWVALEIYFAHRNYLPALGLVFCLVFWILSLKNNQNLWRGVFIIYLSILGGITWLNTSLWGQSELAAEIWSKEQPQSLRAAMNLAYELERTQGISASQIYLDRFVTEERDSVGIRMIGLVTACYLQPDADHSERVHKIINAILVLPSYEGWATDLIEKLMDPVRKNHCPGISEQQVADIATAFLRKPVYQEQPAIASNMLSIIGLVAMDHGNTEAAMNFYLQSIESSATYAMSNLYLHLAQKHPEYAELERLHAAIVRAPVPRKTTQDEWDQLRATVESSIKSRNAQ